MSQFRVQVFVRSALLLALLGTSLGGSLGASALAAPLDAAAIAQKAADAQRANKTLSFRVSGVVSDDTAGKQKLDVKVQAIPASNVARLTFNAPDALADNIMVVTPNELRQYLYLSNQIVVSPLGSAKLPAGAGTQSSLDMSSLDVSQLASPTQLSRYNLKLLGTTGAAPSRLFQLQALPKSGAGKLLVWVTESGWRPTRVQAFDTAGKLQADLNFTEYLPGAPLTVAKLTSLPKDAEVLKQ